jgi:predicted SPOUT superfamily RNA methylase MTH1
MNTQKRTNSIHLAIPASMVSELNHLREKTKALGLLGRAAAIYRVDEIIIYPDIPDESLLLKHILGYMETPQYLRKHLIKHRNGLRYAGVLPPLRTQHHPTKDRVNQLMEGEIREGVVLEHLEDSYMVDIGVEKPVEVFGKGPSIRSRVTVKVTRKNPLQGFQVKKSNLNLYWGYTLRRSNYRLGELGLSPEFDLTIATSRKGDSFKKHSKEIKEKWLKSKRTLVAFGSNKEGIYEIIKKEGKKAKECFQYILNAIPDQGTKTVRTEEAVHAVLAVLNMFKE